MSRAHIMAGVTGKERVTALEAMHDAGSQQRIDGPVYRDWRKPLAALGELVQNLVSPDRPMRGGDFPEHSPPQRRQLQTFVIERLARPQHGLLEAAIVVVLGRREGVGGEFVSFRTYSTGWPYATGKPRSAAGFRHDPVVSQIWVLSGAAGGTATIRANPPRIHADMTSATALGSSCLIAARRTALGRPGGLHSRRLED
jgi:hypothetical protein